MQLLLKALQIIPSHRDAPLVATRLAEELAKQEGISEDIAKTAIDLVVSLLKLFDVLDETSHGVRLAGQIQNYFRNSLGWYINNNKTVASNWSRSGTAKELTISNLLDQAPYLLKILEQRRHTFIEQGKLPAFATRDQPCSVILIKTNILDKPHFLHQWDQKAERYQLIGGKKRETEVSEETARREFLEEIDGDALIEGKNFQISQCIPTPIVEHEISRTYGALTRYEASVFQVLIFDAHIKMSESDRWISLDEMRSQQTLKGAPIAALGRTISTLHPNLLERLPQSLQFDGNHEFVSSTGQMRQTATGAKPADDQQLKAPDKVTLAWIWKHVPLSGWAIAISTLAGVFVLGINAAKHSFFKEVLSPPTQETQPVRSNPAVEGTPRDRAAQRPSP